MATIATLNLAINSAEASKAVGVLDQLTAAGVNVTTMNLRMRDATDQTAAAEQRRRQVMEQSALSMQNLFRLAMQLVGAYSMIQSVRTAFGDAMTEQRVEMGLRNITGSAQQAHAMIAQLNDYSNSSQFGLPNLENDAAQLARMGFNAQEVVPVLRSLGDAIETTGGGATNLDGVVQSLVRIQDEGQLSTMALRQLEQAGIPAGQALASALNESVVQVMKDVRAGTIDAHAAVLLMVQELQKMNGAGSGPSNFTLWNELGNTLRNMGKDAAGFIDQWAGLTHALQAGLTVAHDVAFALRDIYTYLEGGQPKLQQTAQIVTTLSTVFRILMLVIEALLALQLLSWAASLSTTILGLAGNMGSLLLVMGAIVAVDFGKWLADNTKEGRDFVIQMKEAFSILNAIRQGIGGTLGDVFSRTEKGAGDSWERMIDRVNAIADQANHDMAQPFTPKSHNSYLNDSILNNSLVERLMKGGLPSLDLGGASGWIHQYMQMVNQAAQQTQAQLMPQVNAEDARHLSEQQVERIQDMIDKLKEEQQLVGQTNDLRKMELDILKVRQSIGEDILATDQQAQQLLADFTLNEEKLFAYKQLGEITKGIGDAAGNAFGEFASGAKSAKQALDDLLKSLEKLAIQQFVTKPISDLLGTLGNNAGKPLIDLLFGGAGGYSNEAASIYGDANMEPGLGQALGGVWYHGTRMFADGGIVGGPTFFGMAGGNLGLMGEAGPEAIIPLSRGPDGKLGVRGGGTTNNIQNITMNVQTNDADSFRRNGRQIRQQLSRG